MREGILLVNWKSLRDESVPFIDCEYTQIPDTVVSRALLFAARACPACPFCKGTCRCGHYAQSSLSIMDRYIRNWDRQRFIDLHRKVTWMAKERKLSLGPLWLMEDAMRHPTHRHPETSGFEIDHAEGERWRRFNPMETKGKFCALQVRKRQ